MSLVVLPPAVVGLFQLSALEPACNTLLDFIRDRRLVQTVSDVFSKRIYSLDTMCIQRIGASLTIMRYIDSLTYFRQ